jgi:23S rRNA pseudouridine1911/1915/1917 synthase
VYEDEDLVVVEKPAGLLAAPTPESDRNNLASLLERRESNGPRILVVHRIDLETSGLMVFAKTPHANRVLSDRFKAHDLERAYLAVVTGSFPDELALIDKPVNGRAALTHVAVRERFGTRATLIACRLETGRTHQIRLHVLAAGYPVIGDDRYGVPFSPSAPRMALHATTLGFAHPSTGAPLSFSSPWPGDLAAWTDRLRAAVGGP